MHVQTGLSCDVGGGVLDQGPVIALCVKEALTWCFQERRRRKEERRGFIIPRSQQEEACFMDIIMTLSPISSVVVWFVLSFQPVDNCYC